MIAGFVRRSSQNMPVRREFCRILAEIVHCSKCSSAALGLHEPRISTGPPADWSGLAGLTPALRLSV